MSKTIIILMLILQAEITLGIYTFTQINHVQINESWRTIGDTATVTLPRLARQLTRDLKVGDPVSMKLGYEGVYFDEEFTGFVSRISPTQPYEVECEDYIFHAKRTNLKKLFKNTTLLEVATYIVGEVNAQRGTSITIAEDVPEVNFDRFRLNNVSAAKALQKIKEEYGLTAYFRGTVLFVGLPFTDLSQAGQVVNYSTSWNIISSDLHFIREEDRAIRIKAISVLKDNQKLEVEVGDPDGELRTLFFYKISDPVELKKLATAKLSTLKYSGFEGSFLTFFVPVARHSMVANIEDPEYNEGRTGLYLIDGVTKEFGVNGARRKIEIGIKLG